MAVALGTDPAVTYAATAPLPPGIDELMFAGFLRGKPVELARCATVDLEVPADAEIVLEGYVERGEMRREGPFGDHTGYYSLADDYPVFHLTAMSHRRDAVYPATIVGRPPMEDCLPGQGHRAPLPAAAAADAARDRRHGPAGRGRLPQLRHRLASARPTRATRAR